MRDFTQGPVLRPLLAFALPIVGANLLQTFYNLVDTFWVGRLGGEALAAVGLGSVIYHILLSLSWGFSAAATALVSQHFGAGRRGELGRISANLLLLFVGLAAVLAALTYGARMPLLRLLGTPPPLEETAALYLAVNLLALPLSYAVTVMGAILRGVGDSVSPLKVIALGNVINVVLDPILIFGAGPLPALGVAGAAWATVLGRLAAAVAAFATLQRGSNPTRIVRGQWGVDERLIATALRIGSPAGMANLLNSIGGSLLMRLMTPFGTAAVAAHSVGVRLESLVAMPAVALGQAASNWVGQNLGAGHPERAFRGAHAVIATAFLTMAALGGGAYAAAPHLVQAFAPGEGDVIAYGTVYLHILAPSWCLFGTQIVISNTLRGAGDTVANLVLSSVNLLLFRYPAAYLFSHVLGRGAPGVWWGILAGDFLIAVAAYAYFRSCRWMKRTVVTAREPGSERRWRKTGVKGEW